MNRPDCPKCGKPMASAGTTPAGVRRWRCGSGAGTFCYTTTDASARVERGQSGRRRRAPVFTRTIGKTASRFLVTAAQNATPVHKGFFAALQRAAEHLSAELLVVPIRYKNPTSRWTASQANEETWAPELQPYLFNTRKALNKNLVLLGDVKTQPTASSPLTGFDAMTHGESCILAHTKLQLKTVPTPQSSVPKILTTTGAVTVPNYTDSKTGALGAFHHTIGAALVETRGKLFHLRQINADRAGGFQDLGAYYSPEKVAEGCSVSALIMGDTHVDFIDAAVERATFGEGGLVDTLRPSALVWHDLLDAYAVNPHHAGDPFKAIAKYRGQRQDIEGEVKRACEFVRARTGEAASYIISSNHDDMLSRWVRSTDWRSDPVNAEFYLATALYLVERTRLGPGGTERPDAFASWVAALAPGVTVVPEDTSLQIAGIEVGMHGHRGPNGARGSRMNLRRIGVRSVIGHSHSPGIEEGCYQTGTSTRLRLEYNPGPSSWLNTHCLVYPNGKRTLVNIINGEWRA